MQPVTDTVTIEGLELWTRIGVPEDERKAEQRVLVTVEMTTETFAVAESDDVARGVDYFAVAEEIRALAAGERKTIERLAEDVSKVVLAHSAVEQVRVTVEKFPIPYVRSVSVSIERSRHSA